MVEEDILERHLNLGLIRLAEGASKVLINTLDGMAQLTGFPQRKRLQKVLLKSRKCLAMLLAAQVLEHIDVSYVKMRPELTFELTANAKLQESITQIVEAAEPRGVAVIADEVQDTSSLAVLWQCGIKLIAGSFVKESTQVVAQ